MCLCNEKKETIIMKCVTQRTLLESLVCPKRGNAVSFEKCVTLNETTLKII